MRSRRSVIPSVLIICVALLSGSFTMLAAAPETDRFQRTWARADKPVADLIVSRTWMWGPIGNTGGIPEAYVEAPGGQRLVQYFDKSRMEDNHYRAPDAPWDVTNGLLVVELMTGQMQVGDNAFDPRSPAQVNVAGDADDPTGPTYATMGMVRHAAPMPEGSVIIQRIDRDGVVTSDAALASQGIAAVSHVAETNHRVASVFWAFMTSSGTVWDGNQFVSDQLFLSPFYATGLPVTEAYWANVKVAGTYKDVLLQCFERRCLTYTPGNPEGWRVEAGNVGQHYYAWRYTGAARIYVADSENHRIQIYEDDGSFLFAWGSEGIGPGEFSFPVGLAASAAGEIYVADSQNHRIQVFDLQGTFLRSWGSQGTGPGLFHTPWAVALDSPGNVYVSDAYVGLIHKFTSTGTHLRTWGSYGSGEGQLNRPVSLAISGSGRVYVADAENNRIEVFDENGGYLGQWGEAGSGNGQFDNPSGVALDAAGNVYVVETGNWRMQVFSPDGVYLRQWSLPQTLAGYWTAPNTPAIDRAGNVYLTDFGSQRVLKYDDAGTMLTHWGGIGSGPGELWRPQGIALIER